MSANCSEIFYEITTSIFGDFKNVRKGVNKR